MLGRVGLDPATEALLADGAFDPLLSFDRGRRAGERRRRHREDRRPSAAKDELLTRRFERRELEIHRDLLRRNKFHTLGELCAPASTDGGHGTSDAGAPTTSPARADAPADDEWHEVSSVEVVAEEDGAGTLLSGRWLWSVLRALWPAYYAPPGTHRMSS